MPRIQGGRPGPDDVCDHDFRRVDEGDRVVWVCERCGAVTEDDE